MPSLDLRSLAAMSGIMAVVLGLVLLGVRANFPASIRGLRYWGLAPLLCASSTVLFVLSGVLPNWLLVLAGNGLLMVGFAFFLFGSQRFLASRGVATVGHGGRRRAVPHGGVFVGAARLPLACAGVHQHLGAGVRGACAPAVAPRPGFSSRLAAGVLAAQVLVLVGRGVSSLWLDSADSDRFAPRWRRRPTWGFQLFGVARQRGVLLMASERVRSEFEHLATHDSLTGALARRALLELAAMEMQRWQRYQQPFAVFMLDVDHFKQINDTHGHLVGMLCCAIWSPRCVPLCAAQTGWGAMGAKSFWC